MLVVALGHLGSLRLVPRHHVGDLDGVCAKRPDGLRRGRMTLRRPYAHPRRHTGAVILIVAYTGGGGGGGGGGGY
jgi:hypothetical protein